MSVSLPPQAALATQLYSKTLDSWACASAFALAWLSNVLARSYALGATDGRSVENCDVTDNAEAPRNAR